MTKSPTSLLDGEDPIYSKETVDSRKVYLTPTRVITETPEENRGRALQLNKVSFMKKRPVENTGTTAALSHRYLFLFLSLLFGSASLYALTDGEYLAGGGLVLVSFFTYFAARHYHSKHKEILAEQDNEDIVFINVRADKNGIGFKINKSEVSEFVSELQSHIPKEVEFSNNDT